MKKVWFIIAVSLAMFSGVQSVCAEGETNPATPLMLGLVTPAQFPSDQYDVKGVRLNLPYGRCQCMYGLDLGLINHALDREVGLELGLVNLVEGKFIGLQTGVVNVAGKASALQVGLYNGADDMSGVQVGLINHTRLMRGMQFGLVNVIESNDLSFLPIVNFFF
ncbi:MAG: hypothetical protein MUC65_00555 [Pontiellaceae bacterium]|nr:hypothetical protein [Pontiellaceae bacterium]